MKRALEATGDIVFSANKYPFLYDDKSESSATKGESTTCRDRMARDSDESRFDRLNYSDIKRSLFDTYNSLYADDSNFARVMGLESNTDVIIMGDESRVRTKWTNDAMGLDNDVIRNGIHREIVLITRSRLEDCDDRMETDGRWTFLFNRKVTHSSVRQLVDHVGRKSNGDATLTVDVIGRRDHPFDYTDMFTMNYSNMDRFKSYLRSRSIHKCVNVLFHRYDPDQKMNVMLSTLRDIRDGERVSVVLVIVVDRPIAGDVLRSYRDTIQNDLRTIDITDTVVLNDNNEIHSSNDISNQSNTTQLKHVREGDVTYGSESLSQVLLRKHVKKFKSSAIRMMIDAKRETIERLESRLNDISRVKRVCEEISVIRDMANDYVSSIAKHRSVKMTTVLNETSVSILERIHDNSIQTSEYMYTNGILPENSGDKNDRMIMYTVKRAIMETMDRMSDVTYECDRAHSDYMLKCLENRYAHFSGLKTTLHDRRNEFMSYHVDHFTDTMVTHARTLMEYVDVCARSMSTTSGEISIERAKRYADRSVVNKIISILNYFSNEMTRHMRLYMVKYWVYEYGSSVSSSVDRNEYEHDEAHERDAVIKQIRDARDENEKIESLIELID